RLQKHYTNPLFCGLKVYFLAIQDESKKDVSEVEILKIEVRNLILLIFLATRIRWGYFKI
ncbi:MAG TPA: hypothetical protein VGK38_07455, partial [Prolixibacteraceae bacterium]